MDSLQTFFALWKSRLNLLSHYFYVLNNEIGFALDNVQLLLRKDIQHLPKYFCLVKKAFADYKYKVDLLHFFFVGLRLICIVCKTSKCQTRPLGNKFQKQKNEIWMFGYCEISEILTFVSILILTNSYQTLLIPVL